MKSNFNKSTLLNLEQRFNKTRLVTFTVQPWGQVELYLLPFKQLQSHYAVHLTG